MNTHQKWFLENLEEIQDSFDFRLENILFEIGEKVSLYMKEQNLNRVQLAERLGVSRSYVTQILNSNPNLTVKTLLKLSDVLNQELDIVFKSKQGFQQKAPVPNSHVYHIEDFLGQMVESSLTMDQLNSVHQTLRQNTQDDRIKLRKAENDCSLAA
jgi:transcriptional regulator with XRE-family HTH domain